MLPDRIDNPEDPRHRIQKPLPQRIENIFFNCRTEQMERLIILIEITIPPLAPLISMHAARGVDAQLPG